MEKKGWVGTAQRKAWVSCGTRIRIFFASRSISLPSKLNRKKNNPLQNTNLERQATTGGRHFQSSGGGKGASAGKKNDSFNYSEKRSAGRGKTLSTGRTQGAPVQSQ